MNKITINECITQIKEIMESKGYAYKTIQAYSYWFDDFLSFCNERNYLNYEERIGLEYLNLKFDFELTQLTKETVNSQKFSIPFRTMKMIGIYSNNQAFIPRFSRYHEPVKGNVYWENIYNSFMEYLKKENDYKDSTIRHKELTIRAMLNIIIQKKVLSLDDITKNNIEDIISQFIHEASKSICSRLGDMKQFFNYCYCNNLCNKDISLLIPNIKPAYSSHIPTNWKVDDVKKLLESIDRDNQVGKRDYAILLLACRLGLRAIDLISLKLSDFNWETKQIIIKQKKTQHTINLPILNDVGWAIIDYIKNGRPETSDDKLFIRSNAPFDGFSNTSSLERIFTTRMNNAGISIPREQKHGIHSLRHTLGRILLEKDTSLPIISQILGHQSIQSTEVYLHINMKGLESCPIDPNRVFK